MRLSQSCQRLALSAALLACVLLVFTSRLSSAADVTLNFPGDRSCGLVLICHRPEESNGLVQLGRLDRVIGPAEGEIVVPADAWVLVEIHGNSAPGLNAIRNLSRRGIHGLRISGGELDRATLASICEISSLELLELRDCRLPDEGFRGQPALPALRHFTSFGDESAQANDSLATWLRSCPRLEYLFCDPKMNAAQWRVLSDHPRLAFVTVALGADATELLRSLKNLPRLRGMNLYFLPDADHAFVDALAELDGLAWINWTGGQFDERTARAMSRLRSLRTLVLQGQAKLAAAFPDGLPALDQLERLTINTSETGYTPPQLFRALCQMPALNVWPLLSQLDAASFAEMARRNDVSWLELSSIDPDVDREQLKSWLARLPLKRLQLSDDRLSGLEFLADLEQLESLRLNVRGVDDDQLAILTQLPRLKELSINVGGAERLSYAPLGHCPVLETLSITGEIWAARDLESLGQSPALRSLSFESGYVDDAAVDWILQIPSLRELNLGRDCMLTDAGVARLSTHPTLEVLDVGGLITADAAAPLQSMRRLRGLVVRSPLLSTAQQESLAGTFAHLAWTSFPAYEPLRGPWIKGTDGLLRVADAKLRALVADLEGNVAPALRSDDAVAPGASVDLEKLRGQVVVVDFWGVWCEPCLNQLPLLVHLQDKYGGKGLRVVAVHSALGADRVDAYLAAHPKPFLNVVDADGTLAKSYGVDSWPSLYVIDKAGRVRVALAHVLGLEAAIVQLLAE